ncbi:MAG: phage antirepressor KilAC domain-containing protein [Vibrio litoralis]|uniref:phage antirepressor KilAC domain-containing protein n=1 Tax=Vibrio litoralis TaxID=335972 RepID=UPI003F960762
MFELSANSEMEVSTFYFWNVINEFRANDGFSKIRHDDFIARVEDEIDDLKQCENFAHPRTGKQMILYRLNQEQMLLVGMRESKVVRKKVLEWINKLTEPKVPQTYADALLLAANQAKELEEKNQALALAAPKAEFVDRYVESTGLMTFRQVAKQLEIKEPTFRSFLVAIGAMYQLGGSWSAYQKHIDAGRFKQRQGEKNGHAYVTTKFTPKGVEWVARKWNQFRQAAA